MLLETTEARNMRMSKIKQISLVLCCVFSLFVSSVSACYCGHGEAAPQKEQHCAPQSLPQEKTENHSAHHDSRSDSSKSQQHTSLEAEITVNQSDECCCAHSVPKIYAKSEGVSIQKQSAVLLILAPVNLELISQGRSINKTVECPALFYLSDSFYNLPPGRAPPRL
jgi:hypothetical protein